MTEGTARLTAATRRRRLALAAEPLTLPYDAGAGASGDAAEGPGGDAGTGTVSGATGDAGAGSGLGRLLDEVDAVAGRLRAIAPERIHPDGLGDALSRLRRVRNRLEAVETSWLAQARARKVHRDQGASSPSKWAAEQLGGSQRDAVDQLITARRMDDLPDVAGAFSDGDITRQSASAIGRAMQDDRLRDIDGVEQQLLDAARAGGPDEVRKAARRLKATADVHTAEADARRKRAERRGQVLLRDDGMVKIDALLDSDNGEPFYTAFQALFNASLKHDRDQQEGASADGDGADGDGDGQVPVGERTAWQRGADVLGEMARRLLATGDQIPDAGGRSTTVLVTIPEATLRGRLDDGAAQLRFTGEVPPSTARRHACDAGIVPVVLNGRSVPIDIGRASREPTAAQRRCLLVRDRGRCRNCGRADRLLYAHHCHHWADGGPTDLHNLILVCWDCHQLLHEGKWTAKWHPDNTVTFTHPDGRRYIRPPPT